MSKPAAIKTKPTPIDPEGFLNEIPDGQKRTDSLALLRLMAKVSGEKPVMWGASIIGFGFKRYKNERSGREVDWFKIGFSPRKANLTLYLIDLQPHQESLAKLGKHKIGGGCLYINKLSDIDSIVLEKIIKDSFEAK